MIESRGRAAFTLMELLLVLGLLVIVGAMVSPGAAIMLNRQRLSSGAENVRAGLIQARLEAMRSGRPQVFQCQIGGSQIQVQPWVDPADAADAADMAGSVVPGAMGTAVPMGSGGSGTTIELPDGVTCESVQIDASARVMPILTAVSNSGSSVTSVAGTNGAATMQTVSPASPVVLYPDGTATDALIVVAGANGKIELRLRGLTGDITRKEL